MSGIDPTKYRENDERRVSPLYVCLQCGAVIDERTVPLHEEWHEVLRRAVDETGSLG